MYIKGHGVPASLVHTVAWWNLAAAQEDKNAATLKAAIRVQMTAKQIAQAQKLSNEWLRENPKLMGQ